MTTALEWKEKGNAAFQQGNYDLAIECFTKGLETNPNDHVLYSNRSGAFASKKDYQAALADAAQCVTLKPDWVKGWTRKGLAEFNLQMLGEAIESYRKGLELDPQNVSCKQGLESLEKAASTGIRQEQLDLEIAKILSKNPKLAKYCEEDGDYAKHVSKIVKGFAAAANPQAFQTYMSMESDPRVREGVAHVFGVPLAEEGEQAKATSEVKPSPEKAKEEKTEDTRSTEEIEAEDLKLKGNDEYKKRNFEKALELYTSAYEKNPKQLLYLSNKAAVYHEMGEFDQCIQLCEEALEKRYEVKAPFETAAKLYDRIAAAKKKKGDIEGAIEALKKSLTEDNKRQTRSLLREFEREIEKQKANEYINPELSEVHRTNGNKFYKEKNYPKAKEEYDEAIKRNPKEPKGWSNRAATYMALLEYPSALRDIEKCLELDPSFVKGWSRKGAIHHHMKEYNKSIAAYQEGLKLDPKNEECSRGMQQTLYSVRLQQQSGETDPEQVQRAMEDPEIRQIMSDPQFMMILQELQNDPNRLTDYLRDPKIASGLNKLQMAGILRVA